MKQTTLNRAERAGPSATAAVVVGKNDGTAVASLTSTSQWMTVAEVLAELNIGRGTWEKWRQRDVGPHAVKLPNGQLRIRRSVLDEWLCSLPEGG